MTDLDTVEEAGEQHVTHIKVNHIGVLIMRVKEDLNRHTGKRSTKTITTQDSCGWNHMKLETTH